MGTPRVTLIDELSGEDGHPTDKTPIFIFLDRFFGPHNTLQEEIEDVCFTGWCGVGAEALWRQFIRLSNLSEVDRLYSASNP